MNERTEHELNDKRTDKIAVALSNVQAKIEHAKKLSNNPFHKSKYADLAEVWSTVRKILTDHDLCVVQCPATTRENNKGYVGLTTTLYHSSGQSLSSYMEVEPKNLNPQSVGGAITYMRRYALCAMVGVVADEDDDGNYASGVTPKKDLNQIADPTTIDNMVTAFHQIGITATELQTIAGKIPNEMTLGDIERLKVVYSEKIAAKK